MTHGKMVITAQVETFNNLNQYNLIIKCRWPKLCTFVQKFPTVTERQNCVLGSVRLIGGIKKRQPKRLSFFYGAGGRTRTGTVSLPVDFESTASANSATRARNA
mgnify:FL=1